MPYEKVRLLRGFTEVQDPEMPVGGSGDAQQQVSPRMEAVVQLVEDAVGFYTAQHGSAPTRICIGTGSFVNEVAPAAILGLPVRVDFTLPPNHFELRPHRTGAIPLPPTG